MSFRVLMAGLMLSALPALSETNQVTLDQCVQHALGNNPQAEAAGWRVEQSRSELDRSLAPYYPQLSLGGSYAASDNPSRAFMMQLNQQQLDMMSADFDPNNPDRAENINLHARVGYRVFDLERGQGRKQAAAMLSAAQHQHSGVRNELVYQVVEAYLNALKARELAEVHRITTESLRESLRVAGERVKAGTAVRTDVLNLEVRIAEQEQYVIRARNAAEVSVAALNTAIGEQIITVDELTPPAKSPPCSADISHLFGHPLFRASAARTEAARRVWKKADAAYIPKVELFGQYDVDTADFSDTAESYFAGASLTWDAFDGFNRRNAVRGADAAWRAAEAMRRQTFNQLAFELNRAQLLLSEAEQRLEVARRSVTSAEEALRMTQAQYEQGTAEITALLVAQVGRASARSQLAAATYDARLALAALMRADGSIVQCFVGDNAERETVE